MNTEFKLDGLTSEIDKINGPIAEPKTLTSNDCLVIKINSFRLTLHWNQSMFVNLLLAVSINKKKLQV